MRELEILPMGTLGHGFIPKQHLPAGQDEYYLRNGQALRPAKDYRKLLSDEIEALVKNANTADNWDNVLVTEQFNPMQIKNCEFYGLVRIGRLEEVFLSFHDMAVPVGLTNSRIIACDLGDDVAIHHVRYLAHYIVGDNAILLNLDEMHTTNYAKFGNGIVKEGEDEKVRAWMDLINEAGGRSVLPFDGMIAADAYLWSKYRGDAKLMDSLKDITQKMFDPRRGFYGKVGNACVVKNCGIIKDVNIGPFTYIKGANKLKNLTINSSEEEPTQIGEGVELVNGIIGRGCHIFYGSKAVRFVMGNNSSLKYGARLIHSLLGDNSTVSCCELLSNLIFPAHEQHHNNSFLIAALVMGQSNIAACATIGSNHNSRAPDGEVQAGRGYWPGLCTSIKHNCRFASFTLMSKADYAYEMDIRLPFSLLSNDAAGDRLLVLPAYWWMYNMYALARNTWKFNARDKRKCVVQHIEFDCLAPDTAEEIFTALDLLAEWTGNAYLRRQDQRAETKPLAERIKLGRLLLNGPAEGMEGLEILAENAERSERKVVVLKAQPAWQAYHRMLHYYAVKNLLAWMSDNPGAGVEKMCKALAGPRQRSWANMGGQLVKANDLNRLIGQIKAGRLKDWNAIHRAYDRLWKNYVQDKRRHALASLLELLEAKTLTGKLWEQAVDQAVEIQRYVSEQTYLTRKKDYDDPFRRITFDGEEEFRAVLGSAEENSFVRQVRQETDEFIRLARSAKKAGR